MSTGATPDHFLKIIFGVLAILLNGILLAAMFKDRKKIFVTRISYLVANLALADCITGLTLVFIEPEYLKHKDTPKEILDYKLSIIWTPMTISFLTLFLMSVERLVVVVLPMIWTTILTITRTILCIIFIWCLSIVGGIFMKYHDEHTQFVLTIVFEVSALFFVGIHIYILSLLRRRERLLTGVDASSQLATPWVTPELTSTHLSPAAHSKVTAVVAILILVLILTFFPHFVCLQMFTVNRIAHLGMEHDVDSDMFTMAFNYTDAFSYLNFVVNPIIYAWRLRMYRKAFSGLLQCTASQ